MPDVDTCAACETKPCFALDGRSSAPETGIKLFMKMKSLLLILTLCAVASLRATGATITVTTTNNASPGAGQVSLLQALEQVADGDEIRFNIPGTGPHFIETPVDGYPLITANNVTINGYSQPGASPNSNPILATNNARIQIVLDSRNGGRTPMQFPLTTSNDDPGFLPSESTVLGAVDAQGLRIQGLSFLGVPAVGPDGDEALGFISLARGASGQISGCWLGVAPDGRTVAGAANGIVGIRYRGRDATLAVTNTVLVNNLVIGAAPKATNAVQQFNVIAGMPVRPINVEGDGTRISGNFITVLPDGLHDVNVALDDALKGQFLGAVAIGRGGNNTLIGVDGDGVNDENERNVFGGMLPFDLDGYEHLIEFYGQNPGTNVVIAGNYVGIGIDGQTRFTNGVPVLNAAGAASEYRIGSNFDGVSDALEGNLIANNYPPELFPASGFQDLPEALSFLSQLNAGASVSMRGNSLINNFPFPASPLRDGGFFLASYYAKALANPESFLPTLATNSTRTRLIGTVPLTDTSRYTETIVDVYVADPVGMTNGMGAEIPELPQGFIQGVRYLGSFVEGSSADLESQPGAFEFALDSLNIPAGALLTVTANYVAGEGGSGGEAGSFTSFSRSSNGSVTLQWDSGILESAPAVTGPWTEETTTGNSFSTTPADAMRFFRLAGGGTTAPEAPGPPLTSPFSNIVAVP